MPITGKSGCYVVTNEGDEAVRRMAGMGRKQWAAPRDSIVQGLINADMTSSSAGSVSLTDDDRQSLSGQCTLCLKKRH